ncbi:putative laccase [Helianthus anomalus]
MFKIYRFNFFVLGKGLGNYNPKVDPNNFNLVDPMESAFRCLVYALPLGSAYDLNGIFSRQRKQAK